MNRWIRRAGLLAASMGLLASSGCGESTEIPLAKVPIVTPTPNQPKKPSRRGVTPSPEVLPGQTP